MVNYVNRKLKLGHLFFLVSLFLNVYSIVNNLNPTFTSREYYQDTVWVSQSVHTHNSESQEQAVGVAAAVAGIFISNFCVVILLVFFFLLHLVCVRLVGCRLVCHPACGDGRREGFTSRKTCFHIIQHVLVWCNLSSVTDLSNVKTLDCLQIILTKHSCPVATEDSHCCHSRLLRLFLKED